MYKYGGSEQVHAKLASNDAHDERHPVTSLPSRWNFCLFVDEACLRSLTGSGSEAVKILTTDWQEDRVDTVAEGWEDGETDEDEEVGWLYIDPREYVDVYDRLDDAYDWDEFYQTPYEGYVEDLNDLNNGSVS